MDKDVEDVLEFWKDKETDSNLWDLTAYFDSKIDRDTFEKIFTKEQAIFLGRFLKNVIWAIDEWHNKKDEESHNDIRTKLNKTEARLRNHRHDTSKMFSGKAEY